MSLVSKKGVKLAVLSVIGLLTLTGCGESTDEIYSKPSNYDKPIIVSVLDEDTIPLASAKPLKDFILVIGNESHGVSEGIIAKANQKVKIEMSDKIDSLNAAIAAGILMNHYK